MSPESRRLAGVLLVVLPTVMAGGAAVLTMLVGDPAYAANPLRQDLWRAGHAHAGVLLVLSLVALRYVDEARLGPGWKRFARASIPASAILMPLGFFLSVVRPDATEPNGLLASTYAGGALLAAGVLVLGVGLIRRPE
jgi:hypothetical protein